MLVASFTREMAIHPTCMAVTHGDKGGGPGSRHPPNKCCPEDTHTPPRHTARHGTAPQMGVFDGGEWWVEGHVDAANATQALHCLRLQHLCGELKKSKAVFTPHLPGGCLGDGGWCLSVCLSVCPSVCLCQQPPPPPHASSGTLTFVCLRGAD